MHGWAGRILRVNLTTGEIKTEPINEVWAREYIGGRGLAARYLFDAMDPKVDALSPENVLIFATGPLTGTNTSCGARYMVVTKGALTNAITTSNSGGHWGPELKFAGYDMVILHGRAPEPVYLWIHDDHVELRSAKNVWGRGVFETEDMIRDEVGMPDAKIAGIGPAGENLVRFACVMNDKHRAAGRSGVGAVMGSKNLKAIAVRGTRGVSVARPADFLKALWGQHHKMHVSDSRKGMSELGTAPTIDLINAFGGLPTRNFAEGQFEHSEKLNGNAIKDTRMIRNKACFACTIACGRVTHLPGDASGKFMVNTHPRNWKIAGEGPEYENAWSLGAAVGVGDLDAVLKANWLCNDLGMDPISMGATLAAAMELYERGVITDKHLAKKSWRFGKLLTPESAPRGRAAATTKIPLRFGSGEALVRMTEATAYREGFGALLAEGSARLGRKFRHMEVHMGVKGQDFPAYDPRGFQGMGVAYATCNRGACHLRAWTPAIETSGDPGYNHSTEGKSGWVISEQNKSTAHDNTGVCLFIAFAGADHKDLAALTSAATGVDFSEQDYLRAGERTWNLEKLWNLRAGLSKKDDTLPERLLKEGHKSGPSAGVTVHLDQMLPEYYKLRDWTASGKPSQRKLKALGLEALAV